MLVRVHPADNGLIGLFEDSNAAQAGKVLAMTISVGPLGLLAYGVTRGLRAQCETCGMVFARNRFSLEIEKKLTQLLESGDLVLRAYQPPPVAAYNPNEVHAPTPAAVAAQKKRAEDELYNPAVWSFVLLFFTGGGAIFGLSDHFVFDFSHVATEATLIGLSALLLVRFLKSFGKIMSAEMKKPKDKTG